MSFTAGIPASGQSLGSSRLQVLNNFSSLRTTIANAALPNHIDVNATGAGKHIFVEMPVQTPSAANLTLSGEIALLAQTVAGSSEIFFNRDGSNTGGTPNYYQLTSGIPKQGASAAFGQSFLPGGFQLRWGVETVSNGTVISYTAGSRGLSNFPTNTIGVLITPTGSDFNQTSTDASLSASQFTIYTSKSNLQVFWVAIGY